MLEEITPGNPPGFSTTSVNQCTIKIVSNRQWQPVLTSGILKETSYPTHNQGVVGSCPTGPTHWIKHLSFKKGRCFLFNFFRTKKCNKRITSDCWLLKRNYQNRDRILKRGAEITRFGIYYFLSKSISNVLIGKNIFWLSGSKIKPYFL